MARPLSVLDPGIGSAFETNALAFFSRFGGNPGGTVEENGRLTRVSTGVPHPIFNWVLRSRFSDTEAEEQIGAVVRSFREARLPFHWGILPSDKPAGLRPKLVAAGFAARESPGMVVDLADLPSPSAGEEFAIEPVTSDEEMRVFARTLNAGDFRAPDAVASAIPDCFRASYAASGDEPHLRCFLGFRNGTPVATSARFLSGGLVGIWGVATVPEARRLGIGAAMTLAALGDGARQGYRVGSLIATTMGEPVYRRLGFRELFRVGMFRDRSRFPKTDPRGARLRQSCSRARAGFFCRVRTGRFPAPSARPAARREEEPPRIPA